MKIKALTDELEKLAPLPYAEGFDNVGFLVGNPNAELTGALITHDTLEETVEEAIAKNCNLIISFHPIIFKGLTSITGKTYVERVVLKAIKNDITIYATHTALDNSFRGVNATMADKLELHNRKILIPQKETIKKLTTYVPLEKVDSVRKAIFDAGGGTVGNYDHCSFNLDGRGSFRGNAQSNPQYGRKGEVHFEEETQLSVTFPKHRQPAVLKALFKAHPYEEVAYEVITLENTNQHIGMGMIGELEKAMTEEDFFDKLKKVFNLQVIRHSHFLIKPVKKVAVLGGSGAFAISAAKAAGADVYLTGDLKYHDFFQAEGKILLADIGHYESEQFTKELIHSYLKEKFRNFAIVLSERSTNPIQYT